MDTPLQHLDPDDRAFLDLAINHNLNLPALLASDSSHPARHSISTLLAWFAQSHIKAAITFLVHSYTFVDALAQDLSRKTLRAGLEQVFTRTLNFGDVISPTAENADRGTRACRESRLVATAIKRLNTNPRQSAARTKSTPPLPPPLTHHHAPDLSSLAASTLTHCPSSNPSPATTSTQPSLATKEMSDLAESPAQLLSSALCFNLSSRFTRAHPITGISPAHQLLDAAGTAPPPIPKPSPLNPSFSAEPFP
jgi:hypothetical protein